MKLRTSLAVLTLGALALTSTPLWASSRPAAPESLALTSYKISTRITASRRLAQLGTNARQVRRLAARLQSLDMQGNGNFWQYDAHVLNQARSTVNAMDRDLRALERLEPSAAPWQQDAIRREAPSVVELTGHTQDAIKYLASHEDALFAPSYRDDAEYMYRDAARIVKSVNQFEEFNDARRQVRQLGSALRISS